jgi:hypothetical protein
VGQWSGALEDIVLVAIDLSPNEKAAFGDKYWTG